MNEEIKNIAVLGNFLFYSDKVVSMLLKAEKKNPWFKFYFGGVAFRNITDNMLALPKLTDWISRYDLRRVDKTIGLIFAGNIPLAGFHDFLCCYVTGCKMKIKLSSKDDVLFPFILEALMDIDPELKERVEIVDRLKDFDAVIATGSGNTHRYFEYYFRNYPKILRKNRNSVAILTGEEEEADLEALVEDIFTYFGFGCRNVSKIYVPANYDFKLLFPYFSQYEWFSRHSKYMNNYDYNRSILLLNKTPHLANEFVMLTENPSIASPISIVHYEYWHDKNVLSTHLKQNSDKIQCIVASDPDAWNLPTLVVCLGLSQYPELYDYADDIDTISFLLGL